MPAAARAAASRMAASEMRPLGVAVGDVLGGAEAADLAGVERRAAGPVDAVRAVDLADREQVLDVGRFPPEIARQPAVVVLGADGDLQRLGREVDAVVAVELDRAGVHLPQPLDRRVEQGLGSRQVLPGLALRSSKRNPSGLRRKSRNTRRPLSTVSM